MQRWYFVKIFKQIAFFLISFFIFMPFSLASEKINVILSKCVDGDTAKFNFNEEVITARFLAIDTPETKHPTKGEEPFGKEASNFTCKQLTNAKKIELEYDDGSEKLDKYNRHLVWVWIDDNLLQDAIIQKGYAEVAYLYGDYQYTSLLQDHQAIAQKERLGIWGEKPDTKMNYLYIVFSILALIIIYFIGSKKTKRKIKNKVKKSIKKEIQSRL